jgi:hypothetical protein
MGFCFRRGVAERGKRVGERRFCRPNAAISNPLRQARFPRTRHDGGQVTGERQRDMPR